MITEKVKIVVVSNGRNFAKIFDITSLGDYWTVDKKVKDIVNREWKNRPVQSLSWFYV